MFKSSEVFDPKILHSLDRSFIVCVTNFRGDFIYVNDLFCQITKYSRDEILGKNHTILKSGHHPDRCYNELWHAIYSGKAWTGDIKNRAKDGSFFWVLTTITPYLQADRNLNLFVTILFDITEKKYFEEKMKTQKLDIDQAMVDLEMRERFLSTLSHDLKTPLTIAKISCQMIGKKFPETDNIKKLSNRINENITRVDSLVTELLDANRSRSLNQFALKLSEFDMRDVVLETLENQSAIHGDRFRFLDSGSFRGEWCLLGVKRIIENLTTNAIKYGEEDSPVLVSLEGNEDQLILSVRNSGNPISENDQRTIFDYLQRTASAEMSSQNGWGLGLTVVKGMTEAHGGSVRVFSYPNEGTIFTVTLPIKFKAHSQVIRDNS